MALSHEEISANPTDIEKSSEKTETSPVQKELPPLEVCLEALLFVAAGPVTIHQLAEVLGRSEAEIETVLHDMEDSYARERGIGLQWHKGRVQMTTAPALAGLVEKFLGLEVQSRLTRAALETLAIIAYRQPITRPGIDSIRGVSSDGVLRSLLNKGLVEEVGRAEGPGRPILYGVTAEFLQNFGLRSINELPPFELPEESENNNSLTEKGLLKD